MDDLTQEKNSTETSATPLVPKSKGFFRELVEFVIIAVVIVVPFRIFIAQPYVVNGASMDPTFKTGDYLIVDQLSYRFHDPARGSVLVFKYPKNPSLYFIKRVIGLPGETITIKGGIVSIKNAEHPEGFTLDEPYVVFKKADDFSVTMGGSEFFVLGDNRVASADSRLWGPVPRDDILGRPVLELFPIKKMGFFPGDKTKLLQTP